MNGLSQDLRVALRGLGRSPGFAAVAVLTLALGIGANTAIFSVVDAVLLAPLPYGEPERLAVLVTSDGEREDLAFSPATFLDLARDARSLGSLAAWASVSLSLTGDGPAERLSAGSVSAGFFETLEVAPAIGGGLGAAPEGEPVVLLADGIWRRRYHADPAVVGRSITLDGVGHRIAGVLPADFRFPLDPDLEVWVRGPEGVPAPPFEVDGEPAEIRGLHYLAVLARLVPGVTIEQAEEELGVLGARYAAEYPEDEAGRVIGLEPLREAVVGDLRPVLLLLLGAVALVLLIACANVSSLLLARAVARGRELAIRSSLGAGRSRLVRQALVEGLVLSLAGGAVGLLLGAWGVEALLALAPPEITDLGEVSLDAPVLLFAGALSLVSVLLFSLIPALRASRPALREALLEGGARAGDSRATTRVRAALVVGETALAVMLLVGAGLLLRSLHRLESVEPGIRPERVLAATVALPDADYPESAQVTAFWDTLHERLAALPGVTATGHVLTLPFGGSQANTDFVVEGEPPPAPGRQPNAGFQAVSSGYFRAVGIPLLEGRSLEPTDRGDGEQVVVVSRAMAERFFPGGDAVGRRINLDPQADDEPWLTIVGVVGDVRHTGLDGPPRPEIYFPYPQFPWRFGTLVLRTAGEPAATAGALRAALAEIDPDLPLLRVRPLADYLADSTARRRFLTVLLGLFATLAATLAALGLYGVIAYGVVQRRREIGIRMALGARRGPVQGSIVGRGLALAAGGVAIGVVGALALRRLLAAQLFEVSAADPATYAAVALLLTAVAALASWLPARRAAAVDPAITLRAE